ncbi:MAG: nucleotidyltransferase domain-containing protein [Thermodesulfovibrionales bacterium]|nr:nucleotidyltransferase domain-containing protein [Thermodesulfovibrionales bacterium]
MDNMLGISSKKLEDFCRENHILRLSLFGSTLTGEAVEDSDVDLLVKFDASHTPGFLGLAAMERELSEMIGRRVDLRTSGDLSRYFRQEVLATAKVQYAQ